MNIQAKMWSFAHDLQLSNHTGVRNISPILFIYMKIGVLGGGAAGFFSAITCAEKYPESEVLLLEKSIKVLSKVRVSGGGRCNVTHDCHDNGMLVQNYPRGSKELRSAFERFSVKDTIEWFNKKGVKLKTEKDGRMFPTTDSSETIAQCLLDAAKEYGVKILTNLQDLSISKNDIGFRIDTKNGGNFLFDKLIIATGGFPKKEGFKWLEDLGHDIINPVPSLFTFNLKDHPLKELPGVAVENAEVKIAGSKLSRQGPLLITHWGLSGPAILKLSAWGARELNASQYKFNITVNWLPQFKDESLHTAIDNIRTVNSRKMILSFSPFPEIPRRLWEWIASKTGVNDSLRWADISKKTINLLTENLLRAIFEVEGKSTFKDEFVTAGGVSLKDVDFKTMQSKKCPGLYFAGEVIDVDAVTGGFNFQAAWTTGYIAGISCGLE
jgi:predicted Rossmann fold flavoprotein